ncbi:MASE1 domain-containing protein [Methyloprofundus sp.]|uniref:MASE1 domain-containing protein n=1 Tax=Methyloprofundus sp. TaxID=2020875 RepID=UPI003D09701A
MIKNLLKGNIILLLVYVIGGLITLNLSIAPSGVSPMWVPAGIASGAVLIWGYRLLPAVFAGSFLVAQYLLGLNDKIALFICLAIGLQAVLQSWLVRFLLIKFKIWPTRLLHDKDIVCFFLVAGLVATFFPAAFIVSVDLVTGVLNLANWLDSLIIWWVGNALGVILFTPIVLTLFALP